MSKRKDFNLQVKNLTDASADMYIYGDIVSSEWDRWELEDVAPENIREQLDAIKGKNLNIFVNSGGGSVFAGLAIYNMLKRHEGFKTIHVDGVAASISSIIAFAGDKLIIPKSSYLMIHKPWVASSGNANDLRKTADDLDRIEEGLLNIYEANLNEGIEMSEIKAMLENETWLSGIEAAKYFNVEVTESQAVASIESDFLNSENVPESLKAAPQLPSKTEPQPPLQDIDSLLLEIDFL